MNERQTRFSARIIAEIIGFVALSTALSYVKVFSLPQGGSVTAGSMVPVIWLSLRRGPKIGLFAGAVYGLVQLMVEPFVYHPVQVLLDYPIAFGALGLAGFFQKRPKVRSQASVTVDQLIAFALSAFSFALFCYELTLYAVNETLFFSWLFAFSFLLCLWLQTANTRRELKAQSKITPALIGATIGIFGRFVAHFVSGVVFFGEYAPEGMSPIIYSAIYNGIYIIPELLVSAYFIYLIVKSGMLRVYE
ncbi:MAG: energy-coupled thiamine transporter ThiT [Thermoproteota archaeon]|nr:energy-coupled thiamine transporter ThiT [Thermoproteota archaeon]